MDIPEPRGEYSEIIPATDTDKKSYQCNMETRLAELGAKIDEWTARAETAAAEQIADLKLKRQAASCKLEELKAAGEEAWAELKVGLDRSAEELNKAWAELRDSSRRAAEKLSR